MLDFYVDENVLIPRADTEIAVQEAIKIIKKNQQNDGKRLIVNKKTKILDMCTGSGTIAIAIAKYTDNTEIQAVDISKEALTIAKKNADINEVSKKCKFIQSNMFEKINEQYDMIISNPPYIKQDVIKDLERNVQREPIIALDGGIDGLNFYRVLADKSYKYLNDDGYLILEIGYDQKIEVTELLENTKKYESIKCIKDLANNDRVIIAKKIR